MLIVLIKLQKKEQKQERGCQEWQNLNNNDAHIIHRERERGGEREGERERERAVSYTHLRAHETAIDLV